MRGTVAKQLRKEARKVSKPTDFSIKRVIKSFIDKQATEKEGKEVRVKYNRDTVVCTGYRRVYKDLKKARKA